MFRFSPLLAYVIFGLFASPSPSDETFRSDYARASVVGFGWLANGKTAAHSADAGNAELWIAKVYKGREKLKDPRLITASSVAIGLPKSANGIFFARSGQDGAIEVYRFVDGGFATAHYFEDLIDFGENDHAGRLSHCFDFLEHVNPNIAIDALSEFASASTRDIAMSAKRISPHKVRRYLKQGWENGVLEQLPFPKPKPGARLDGGGEPLDLKTNPAPGSLGTLVVERKLPDPALQRMRDELVGACRCRAPALYIQLLAFCGIADDRPIIESFLRKAEDPDSDLTGDRSLLRQSGYLAFIRISPDEGWKKFRSVMARATKRKDNFSDLLMFARILRDLTAYPPDRLKEADLDAATADLLAAPEIADMVIDELTMNGNWRLAQQVLTSANDDELADNAYRRKAMTKYALRCPKPEAAKFVDRMRKAYPEMVMRLEQELREEKSK